MLTLGLKSFNHHESHLNITPYDLMRPTFGFRIDKHKKHFICEIFVKVFVCVSGVGYYAPHSDKEYDEGGEKVAAPKVPCQTS